MERISERTKDLLKQIEQCSQAVKMLDELGEMPANVDARVLSLFPITIKVSSLGELHNVRKWLRHSLKTWEDKIGTIWYSQGEMLAEYNGLHHPINIWLAGHPEDFPTELQSEKCRVVELEPITTKNYAYVCDNRT